MRPFPAEPFATAPDMPDRLRILAETADLVNEVLLKLVNGLLLLLIQF